MSFKELKNDVNGFETFKDILLERRGNVESSSNLGSLLLGNELPVLNSVDSVEELVLQDLVELLGKVLDGIQISLHSSHNFIHLHSVDDSQQSRVGLV